MAGAGPIKYSTDASGEAIQHVSGSFSLIGGTTSTNTNLTGSIPLPISSSINTPSFTRVTSSGSVAAGAYMVTIKNTGVNSGSFLGSVLKVSESLDFAAPLNNTLSSMSYDATGTEFIIIKVS